MEYFLGLATAGLSFEAGSLPVKSQPKLNENVVSRAGVVHVDSLDGHCSTMDTSGQPVQEGDPCATERQTAVEKRWVSPVQPVDPSPLTNIRQHHIGQNGKSFSPLQTAQTTCSNYSSTLNPNAKVFTPKMKLNPEAREFTPQAASKIECSTPVPSKKGMSATPEDSKNMCSTPMTSVASPAPAKERTASESSAGSLSDEVVLAEGGCIEDDANVREGQSQRNWLQIKQQKLKEKCRRRSSSDSFEISFQGWDNRQISFSLDSSTTPSNSSPCSSSNSSAFSSSNCSSSFSNSSFRLCQSVKGFLISATDGDKDEDEDDWDEVSDVEDLAEIPDELMNCGLIDPIVCKVNEDKSAEETSETSEKSFELSEQLELDQFDVNTSECAAEELAVAEANAKWDEVYGWTNQLRPRQPCVTFNEEQIVHEEDAQMAEALREARIDEGKQWRADKKRLERLLRPILSTDHREKMFNERFHTMTN